MHSVCPCIMIHAPRKTMDMDMALMGELPFHKDYLSSSQRWKVLWMPIDSLSGLYIYCIGENVVYFISPEKYLSLEWKPCSPKVPGLVTAQN